MRLFQTANSVDTDQKADKRRKKKKNRKVAAAAAAVVEDQTNSGTPADSKARHRSRSRGRRQAVCFVCHQPVTEGADVIECDYRRICGKPYHLKCVQLEASPTGELRGKMFSSNKIDIYTTIQSVIYRCMMQQYLDHLHLMVLNIRSFSC